MYILFRKYKHYTICLDLNLYLNLYLYYNFKFQQVGNIIVSCLIIIFTIYLLDITRKKLYNLTVGLTVGILSKTTI